MLNIYIYMNNMKHSNKLKKLKTIFLNAQQIFIQQVVQLEKSSQPSEN